ncbi:MAG: glutamate racemase [Deltaproteobacteria bacterium]|nr:MAG: glutamate racemase [Deltaproteobacteria bacterium]
MEKGKRPIGIFDSGVGGLTVFKEIIALQPCEDIIYLGDTARIPYGTRSPQTILKYSLQNTQFLLGQGIKVLVVACNTSSAVSLPHLQQESDIPIIGVITPGARRAVEVTQNKRVGVIGTEATVRSQTYERIIHGIDSQIKVVSRACPLFVPLAEEGWADNQVTRLTAQSYLSPLREEMIDTLVLGCTHYPLLKGAIKEIMGDGVWLVNSAQETAKEVKRVLHDEDLASPDDRNGRYRFYITDNAERFTKIGGIFLGKELRGVEEIEW